MARAVSTRRKLFFTALSWTIAFLIFFPVLWTVLTSFKTEGEAVSIPPTFLFFDWTLENYAVVQERSDYVKFAMNSVYLALGSTLLALLTAHAKTLRDHRDAYAACLRDAQRALLAHREALSALVEDNRFALDFIVDSHDAHVVA